MKKLIILIALLIGLPAFVHPQNFKGKPQKDITILQAQGSLKLGELLEYSVEWLGIPVGKIILKNEGVVSLRNRNCYHISARSFPNSFIRRLYDLEYEVHTYIDTESLSTLRFLKTRRINKKLNYVSIDFYPEEKKAVYKSWGTSEFIKISKVRDEMKIQPTTQIPKGTQDLLSSFYYLRLLQININQSYLLNIYYNEANWPLWMKVEETILREIRKKGTFEAIKVSITSDLNNFILGKRKFSVYLTADFRRIPLEFRFGSSLGSIRGIIQDLPK